MRHPTRETARIDGRDTAASRFIDDIDSLLSTGKYVWAERTLRGLQEVVERTGRVSQAQRQALANIETGLWTVRRRL